MIVDVHQIGLVRFVLHEVHDFLYDFVLFIYCHSLYSFIQARRGGRLNDFCALDVVAKPTLFSHRDAQVALAMLARVEDYTSLIALENYLAAHRAVKC